MHRTSQQNVQNFDTEFLASTFSYNYCYYFNYLVTYYCSYYYYAAYYVTYSFYAFYSEASTANFFLRNSE